MEEIGRVKQLRDLPFKNYNTFSGIPLHLRVIYISPLLHFVHDIFS
jgi:hypothetical protein